MTVLEGGLVVAVALLTIVAMMLARTLTATIRRLTLLERRVAREARHHERQEASTTSAEHQVTPPEPDGDAVDIRGTDPDGKPIVVPLQRHDRPTLLAFFSTSCGTCVGMWERLRVEGLGAITDVAPVVITKDAHKEDVQKIQDLTSPSWPVVLSSEAWDDYEVPGSPYVMLVSAAPGSVVAEGTPSRWEDLVRMASTASRAGEATH